MERNSFFDNLKVLLIFMTVFAHFIRMSGDFQRDSAGGFIYILAFSFIMQGWFFVSGYFSKDVEKCRNTAVKTFLLPYFLFMPLMFLMRYALFGNARLNLMIPSVALWFLLAMFVYRLAIKDLSRIRGLIPVSAVLFFVAGYIPFLGKELALGRIVSFLIFYAAGFCFKWEYIEKIKKTPFVLAASILLMLLLFTFLISYYRVFPSTIWYLKEYNEVFGMDILEGTAVRLMIGVVSSAWLIILIRFIPDRKYRFTSVGKYTLYIYLLHIPVRYLYEKFGYLAFNDFIEVAAALVGTVIVLWIFSRPMTALAYENIMNCIYKTIIKCVTIFKDILLKVKK
ncbi:MAG: acyltransferase family protein [Eubacteriales bacterium]|jgi:fucose 4-O-acetylase-like acetyltransferase|nr:acyltransferase family protein [Eubacteriales bacterium]